VRQARYLRERYRAILAYTGLILALAAGLMLVPLAALLIWPAERGQAWAFILPAALMGALGLAARRLLRPKTAVVLSLQEGGVIVLLSWVIVCLFSAWPFMGAAGLTFTQALFESVSGWTTTGLSVVNVTAVSHLVLLWRSLTQLAGGAGLAIIMLSALTGPAGPALSAAEGREQLVPQVRQSAKLVMLIYGGYLVVGLLALRLAGLGWFDAVNHAFAAIRLGLDPGLVARLRNRLPDHTHSTEREVRPYTERAHRAPPFRQNSLPDFWIRKDGHDVHCLLRRLLHTREREKNRELNFVTAWLLLRGRFRAAARNGEVRLVVLTATVKLARDAGRMLLPSAKRALR
jgi:hypothetical protein